MFIWFALSVFVSILARGPNRWLNSMSGCYYNRKFGIK